jgi:Long-chain acyl-CoA synthetases (AMP-forming)
MLSLGNIHAMAVALGEYKVFEKEDRFLAVLPLHHIFPLLGSVIVPLYFGSTIIFLKELSSDKILEAFKKYKITVLIGVPRLYELFHRGIMNKIKASKVANLIFSIAKHINSQNLKKKIFRKVQDEFGGHVKYFVTGGAKLDLEIGQDLGTLGFSVIEGYGLTETSPIISFTRPKQIKHGSCGHIIPMSTVKFTEDGELLVKGENVFQGYYNKPEQTAEAFTEDGYFKTGDIGSIDSEGFLTITGRTKEMIVLSNGKNINPMDIETELMKLSNGVIEEVAVLEHDNILKAIILPNFKKIAEMKIQNINETIKWSIIDTYNAHAPKYKKILSLKLVKEELPKTRLGKLRRFKLKEIINDENIERKNVVEPNFEEYRILKRYLHEATNKNIYPDNHIELDLGFDSLEMVELDAFITQNFGIVVDEAIFSNNATVEKLSLYIKENAKKKEELQLDWQEALSGDEEYKLPTSAAGIYIGKIFVKLFFKSYIRVKKEGKYFSPKRTFYTYS